VLSGDDQIRIDPGATWFPHRVEKGVRGGRAPASARAPRAVRAGRQPAAWLRATVVAPLLATVPAFTLLAALMAAPWVH